MTDPGTLDLQPALSGMETESEDFLTRQLLTYLGNKRSLRPTIEAVVRDVQENLGGRKLVMFDGFSGSGAVSRLFKQFASQLITNDLEKYANVVSNCYLSNRSSIDLDELSAIVASMNKEVDGVTLPPREGFIERLYSPLDDDQINEDERVFYTRANGRRIDHFRQLIADAPLEIRDLLLAPLLSEASVHANTSGVFKGFYKNKETGIGQFGGSSRDALTRILHPIALHEPVLSNFECDYRVLSGDINAIIGDVGEVDLAYFDPPYNQHPYGSNYFMLNLITDYVEPSEISKVSGIPTDWNRSAFNKKRESLGRMRELVETVNAKYILVSFNDEGFIQPDEMRTLLRARGSVKEIQIRYNTFRGSRNLKGRSAHVTEHLYLVRSN